MTAPERNLDRLFDEREILALMYRYCYAADKNEPAGMLVAFADDCTVNYDPALPVMQGKQALSDMLYAFLGAVISGSHYISNPLFDFPTPDTALFGCYMYSWQRFSAYPAMADIHRFGRYEIRLTRAGGGWLITDLQLISSGELGGGTRIAEQMGRGPLPVLEPLHTV